MGDREKDMPAVKVVIRTTLLDCTLSFHLFQEQHHMGSMS